MPDAKAHTGMQHRYQHIKTPIGLLHIAQASLLFAVIMVFTIWLTQREYRLEQESVRNDVTQEALILKARLETELNSNVFLVNGLAASITANTALPYDRIEATLAELYRVGRNLRSIGLGPGNRLTNVHPLAGNESALGLYFPDLPDQWPQVAEAIERRETVMAGPFTLVQGGLGLASRTPVFLEDGSYWGVISLAMDYEQLLRAAGLHQTTPMLQLALRHLDSDTLDSPFWGEPALYDINPVRVTVRVPGGAWELAVAPRGGWEQGMARFSTWRAAGMLFALSVVVLYLSFQRNNLDTVTSLSRLRAILDTTHDGIIVIDREGIVREFNPAAETLFGYRASEMLGRSINRLLKPDQRQRHGELLRNTQGMLAKHMSQGRDVVGLHKDGHELPIEVTIGHAVIGAESCYVGVVRDVSERKANEAVLKRLAQTDSLTGALNRRAFGDIADKVFATARRHRRPLSLLTIDADHFKEINDTYGHDGGDQVLVSLVNCLKKHLRTGDTLARFGGEEFLVLLPETDALQAMQTAEKIRVALQELVVHCQHHQIRFTVSIGVASINPTQQDISQLVTAADAALYEAKGAGRNRCMSNDGVDVCPLPPPRLKAVGG